MLTTNFEQVLLEPGYVLEPDCNNEANRFPESGRRFYNEKYKEHFDHLFSATGNWFRAPGDIPLSKRFGEDWLPSSSSASNHTDASKVFTSESPLVAPTGPLSAAAFESGMGVMPRKSPVFLEKLEKKGTFPLLCPLTHGF